MQYVPSLQVGTLLRRYKRFLADVELPGGERVTMHCPNTGSMKNCIVEGSPCWFSLSDNPKRKYPYTWEIATTPTGLASINTGRANALVKEGIQKGLISELQGYDQLQTEVKYGNENSRIDILLSSSDRSSCYVEVKSVTLGEAGGKGYFPDAVSQRGTKHLRELMLMCQQGNRAVLFFCVQHTGIEQVAPADSIDPVYGKTLREAMEVGVEVIAYGATITPEAIRLERSLPFVLPASN